MKRKKRSIPVYKMQSPVQEKPSQKMIWWKYTTVLFSVILGIGLIILILLSHNLPSLIQLEEASDPVLVSRIVSNDGVVLKEIYQKKRLYVPIDLIPEHLKQAVLAIEDRRFYNHWGLDLRRIFYLGFRNIISMEIVGGASTLTAQLAKKLYFSPRRSIIRKIREGITAMQIERTYSKNEILEMYLNYMELGRGAHGVQSAALVYFNKNVDELELQESAFIAGMFQLPYGYFNPDRDTLEAVNRRNIVLRSMVDYGKLTNSEYDSLSQLPLAVVPREEDDENVIAPYFCEHVRQQMERKYGMKTYTEGYTIYTSLDTRVQACANSAVNAFMPKLDEAMRNRFMQKKEYLKWFDPPLKSREEINSFLADSTKVDSLFKEYATVQCALVAIDPGTGHILAMIGGRDFKKWKFNRATQASRQPGSAFKPIVFTSAIDNGWPTTKEFLNQPVVIKMVDGTEWRPSNYEEDEEGGLVTIRRGLAKSYNLIAVRLVQELELQHKAAWYAKRFGFSTQINPFDAVVLGVDAVHPIELTSAYCVFANKGILTEPVSILKVVDKNGNVLEEATPNSKEVLTEATAYIMTDLLQSVMNSGTGISARSHYRFFRPAAGKTGTTNDFRNAWFVGFTPQIAAGVWVGMDDQTISLGEGRTGASTALPIWAPFMRMVHDTLDLPVEHFIQPPGVVRMDICSDSKLKATEFCPKVVEEIFLKGTEPIQSCDIHGKSGSGKKKRNHQQVF
ncbi:PBP1A family penicillin-binding protein [bacterium]|nr:PBP1A family penicillin-binding protein [bacterium]